MTANLNFITPTCPKCDNTTFKLNHIAVDNSSYPLQAVNCTKCGCIISVLDVVNYNQSLINIANALDAKLKQD